MRPELLERGDLRPLRLDPRLVDPKQPGCVTVLVLGTPASTFVLRFLPLPGATQWQQDEWPETSVAGAAALMRCGPRKAMFGRLVVEMRSPRAVIETLVGSSREPLPSVRTVLPHRDPGPILPSAPMGPRPTSIPFKRRALAIEERARREGAEQAMQRLITADANGAGALLVRLDPGCYRMDALSPAASERTVAQGIDLDLEVAVASSGNVLASDATESADATAQFCLGRPDGVRVRFIGSIPQAPVLVLSSRWSFPAGIPEYWSPEARAGIARAVRRYHDRPLGNTLTYESLGITGTTLLPLDVEPGACYVAIVAATRGEAASLALAVSVGQRSAQNHGGLDGAGTTLAFCADAQSSALLEVDARGSGLVWQLGVWQTGRLPIGEFQQ